MSGMLGSTTFTYLVCTLCISPLRKWRSSEMSFIKFSYGVTSMRAVGNHVDFVLYASSYFWNASETIGGLSLVCKVWLTTLTIHGKLKQYLTVLMPSIVDLQRQWKGTMIQTCQINVVSFML